MGEVIGAAVICGFVGWGIWKILDMIFDDDHEEY